MNHDHHPTQGPPEPKPGRAPFALNLAPPTTATDPVCGMSVDPATARASHTYNGQPYYFCCPSCKARFEADLRADRLAAKVARDVNSAEESGVAGTPTYFINDVRYRGALDPAVISAELASMARGRSTPAPAAAPGSGAP